MIILIPVKEIAMIKKKWKLYKVRVNLLIEWDPRPVSIYLAASHVTSSSGVLDQSQFSGEKVQCLKLYFT